MAELELLLLPASDCHALFSSAAGLHLHQMTHSHKKRVAIVVSHPIQHFVHFYRALAKEEGIVLRVIYASSIGAKKYFDKDMGVHIQWNTDLLSGYDHVFLPEADSITSTGFWKINNPSVAAALDEFQPDLVKINGYAQMTMLRALSWCQKHRVPVVLWSDSELLHARSPLKRALKRVALQFLFRKLAGFLTVGDNNQDYFHHYGVPQKRMFRVPFTIDEEAFARAAKDRDSLRNSWRAQLGIPDNVFTVLCVGKLIGHKRPGDLIEAINTICARKGTQTPVAVLFVGDGPLRKALEEEAAPVKDKCFFLGFVNVDKLPGLYVTADALAQVSSADAHPLTMSEASIVGLPLIVSDRVGAVGPTDTARPDVNALVFRCGDKEKLADAIQRLMEDVSLRESMGKASLKIAGELNITASVTGFLQAVDSLVILERSRVRSTVSE